MLHKSLERNIHATGISAEGIGLISHELGL